MNNIENVLERLVSSIEKNEYGHQLLKERRDMEYSDFYEEMKYCEEPRSIEEIVEATEELFDKIWFDRHLSLRYRIETGATTVNAKVRTLIMNGSKCLTMRYSLVPV